jgi:cell division cycle 20, cofactor of APC complex
MTTRPYSTALTPSTPIRTHHHHYHHHSHYQSSSTPIRPHTNHQQYHHHPSTSSSRLKPTSGFLAVVAPVTPQRSSSATIHGGAKTALHSRRKQRPNSNLLSLTEPRHHHHHRSSCGIEPASSADRFISNRNTMNMDLARRALFSDHPTAADGKRKRSDDSASSDDGDDAAPTTVPASVKRVQKAYKRQMMSTLCNIPLNYLDEHGEPKSMLGLCGSDSSSNDKTSTTRTAKDKNGNPDPFALDFLRTMKVGATSDNEDETSSSLAASALAARLLASSRNLPDRPYKTLDAHRVHNDFYLSLMSWSHENVLAVALGPEVFLYNLATGAVQTIFVEVNAGHHIMSVKWYHDPSGGGNTNSHVLAVTTTSNNAVMFFDCHLMQRLTTTSLLTQSDRVISMSWKNEHFLSAGTSNGTILNYDIRQSSRRPVSKCQGGHSSQVCGLAWSPDGGTLASGCNDDALSLWDLRIVQQSRSGIVAHSPGLHVPHAHTAAIKAIAWCPHMSNVLATGGGTRCKHIKIWNTLTGSLKNTVDTGSQVSSLVWSKHNMELCSAHGYVQNQVSLWHYYPALTKMKDFKFHNDRILSMDLSPDGCTMATLGGDEILCLWDMFGSSRHSASSSSAADGRPRNHPVPSFGVPAIR